MTFNRGRLERAADLVANVAFDPEGWGPALKEFAIAVDAHGVAVVPALRRVPGPLPITPGYEDVIRYYAESGWMAADVRLAGLPKVIRSGLIDDSDCVPYPDLQRTDYYNGFMRTCDIGPFTGIALPMKDDFSIISINRYFRQQPYTPDELQAFRDISAKVAHGAKLIDQVETARLQGQSDLLDAMDEAAILLDRGGRVLRMNPLAEAFAAKGVIVRDGQISVRSPMVDAALTRYLAEELRISDITRARPPFILSREGRGPLLVSAQRLKGATQHYFAYAWGLVTLKDPQAIVAPKSDLMAALYRLTPAETRVAIELIQAEGDTARLCDTLGISQNTARHHLKSIFAKTGTGSQAGLVALLLRL